MLSMRRLSPTIWGAFLTLTFAVSLSELYEFAGRYLQPNWTAAATVNSILLVFILVKLRSLSPSPSGQTHFNRLQALKRCINRRPVLSFAPAAIVALLAVLAATATRFQGNQSPQDISEYQIAWITWIPLVEEVVFRVGLGNILRGRLGIWLGGYFSAVAFSLVHSLPTLERVARLEFSAPLGPLILGIFCELIYVSSGKIAPAVAFHGACNATVVIFSLLDARWLTWLNFLYI